MEEQVIIEGSTSENDSILVGEVVSDQDTMTILIHKVEGVHQDMVLANTLLAVLIGGFAAYCFFRFLFKG